VKTKELDTSNWQANKESSIRGLYEELLDAWNRRNAKDFAAFFVDDGSVVGFDGTSHKGKSQIEGDIEQIFANHETPTFVAKVREVRFFIPNAAILRAVAGLVPAGQTDINPALNTVQTLIASRRDGLWMIEHFQNTPAANHGRPESVEKLTQELKDALIKQRMDGESQA
jgi:uncharacterized protein (TIGR02246 family)